MMEFLQNYGAAILLFALFVALLVFLAVTQKNKVQSWLLYAVIEAETYFGSGTGKLKLASVYNLFIEQFPWVSVFLSYDVFASMVDTALATMKDMIENNVAIASAVAGEE